MFSFPVSGGSAGFNPGRLSRAFTGVKTKCVG